MNAVTSNLLLWYLFSASLKDRLAHSITRNSPSCIWVKQAPNPSYGASVLTDVSASGTKCNKIGALISAVFNLTKVWSSFSFKDITVFLLLWSVLMCFVFDLSIRGLAICAKFFMYLLKIFANSRKLRSSFRDLSVWYRLTAWVLSGSGLSPLESKILLRIFNSNTANSHFGMFIKNVVYD